jgi:hypothetical protein
VKVEPVHVGVGGGVVLLAGEERVPPVPGQVGGGESGYQAAQLRGTSPRRQFSLFDIRPAENGEGGF